MNRKHAGAGLTGGGRKCAFCFLTENDAGDGPAEGTPAARGCGHSYSVDKHHDLFRQGDTGNGFFFLISGLVALTLMDPRGNSVFIRLVGGGETLGYRSFLAGDDHSVTATTLTPARYCHIERRLAERLFVDEAGSRHLFVCRLAKGLREANEERLRAYSMTVRERLVHFLLSLAERNRGVATDDGALTITLPMSRGDLAHLIGTVPETLSRNLHKLRDDGIIDCRRKEVTFPDPDRARAEIEDWLDLADDL